MGYGIVNSVVTALQGAGIRADTAFPGGKMPAPEGIVAAVSLQMSDRAKELDCVRVSVFAPAALGGAACEEAADRVCGVLEEMGADCVQNACEFQSKPGLLRVEVLGSFRPEPPEYPFSVTVAGETLPNVVGVTAYRLKDAESGELLSAWVVKLEERITGVDDTTLSESPVEIRLARNGQTEVYASCTWSSWQREVDEDGLKQTRTAVAKSRSVV
ncbi:MAG: hypothetical protein ACI4PO_04780 [Faecousia sp.]